MVQHTQAALDGQIAVADDVGRCMAKIISISAVHTPMPGRAESARMTSASGIAASAPTSNSPLLTFRRTT